MPRRLTSLQVIAKLCHIQKSDPILLVGTDEVPQVLLQQGIDALGLAVCLWMEARREVQL